MAKFPSHIPQLHVVFPLEDVGVHCRAAIKLAILQFYWAQFSIVAYNYKDIGVCYRVPVSTTMNIEYYVEFLRKSYCISNLKVASNKTAKARPHLRDEVQSVIVEYGWEISPHPPYPSDMSPCDYDLFYNLKKQMKRLRSPDLWSR